VKKKLNVLAAITLAIVYYFSASIVSESLVELEYSHTLNSENQAYFSYIATNLLYPVSKTDNLATNFNDFPSPSAENVFNPFGKVVKTTQHLLQNQFVQYSSVLVNTLIQYRKADLLFPFDYFW